MRDLATCVRYDWSHDRDDTMESIIANTNNGQQNHLPAVANNKVSALKAMHRKRYPLCDPSPEGYTQASMWSKFPQDGKLTCRKMFKPIGFDSPYKKHR